jgi:prophage regulatory protein
MSTQSENGGANHPAPVVDRFLREPEVLKIIGVSRMTLRRWEEADLFPKRYKIGPNTVAWKESQVRQWIANRESAAPGASEKEAA